MEKGECAQEFIGLFFQFHRIMRGESFGKEISVDEMNVLLTIALSSEKRLKMTEVGSVLGVKKSAATQAVDRLVRAGILKRAKDKRDRRVVYAELTARGNEYVEEKYRRMVAFFTYIVARMGAEDAAEAQRLLKKYFEAVESFLSQTETEEQHA